MPTAHHHDARRGLALSLASTLEPPAARQARRRIEGASTRADDLDALLADLLSANDTLAYPEDGIIDPDFDYLEQESATLDRFSTR